MPWDLFCRVVDNFGDIGVCWRLAADLADRGQPVRLWTDDARALGWMAPDRALRQPGVTVLDWSAADGAIEPGEVVIEAFGCDPPPAFVDRMARMARPATKPPVWINLEYLSAEPHVDRSHGLPSPQSSGPGAGLVKHFFFPGFTPASGGLLREPDLLTRQGRFDAPAWLSSRGASPNAAERVVSLFCYADAPVAELIDRLADRPTLVLATAGHAGAAVGAVLGPGLQRGAVRAVCLPWLSQPDYDHLLWSCDISWVRGEDSVVRAQWAGRPFVWQIYPQDDGADVVKLDALLGQMACATERGPADFAASLRLTWHGWNGWRALPPQWPDPARWSASALTWRDALLRQSDLVARLQGFVADAG